MHRSKKGYIKYKCVLCPDISINLKIIIMIKSCLLIITILLKVVLKCYLVIYSEPGVSFVSVTETDA